MSQGPRAGGADGAGGAGGAPAAPRPLLHQQGLVRPTQARRSLAWSIAVPPGTPALRLRLAFRPDRSGGVRNLLTLSLFDPHGFRGAGHRHLPRQEVLLSPGWATPGFVAGPLPGGEWTVEIDVHCALPSEEGGVSYDLQVDALPAAPPGPSDLPAPYAATPVTTTPGGQPRWLRGDLHVHTTHSDGSWTVEDVVRAARARGLDFIAVTDHNTSSVTPFVARAVAAGGPGLLCIPGMELTTYYGHANALGIPDWIDWRVARPEGALEIPGEHEAGEPDPGLVTGTMAAAAAEVHRLGGTFVVNHPRATGYPHCTGCRWEFGDQSAEYVDALEVWNGPWVRSYAGGGGQNLEALALWDAWLNAGRRIPAVAGSDGHVAPRRPESQGLTCVYATPDPQSILAAVREGMSYLSCGPVLVQRDPPLGEPLPAGAGAITATLDGLPGPADVYLVAGGQRAARRVVQPEEAGDLTFSLPDPPEAWYRLEVYRQGGADLLALTNPVFRA
jgi:hypothetical protein